MVTQKAGGSGRVRCPFCEDRRDLPYVLRSIKEHLIVLKTGEGHTHVHGPVKDKLLMSEMIRAIGKEAGIEIED